MNHIVPVAVFGVFGVLTRFGIDKLVGGEFGQLPISTFTINIAGSFLAGLIYVFTERQEISEAMQVGLLIGFCGGFTTFSSYSLQTLAMLDKGRIVGALAYLTLSPILGLAAAYLPVFFLRR